MSFGTKLFDKEWKCSDDYKEFNVQYSFFVLLHRYEILKDYPGWWSRRP
jgi:hypothetical protein